MEEKINKERRIFVFVIAAIFVIFLVGMTYAFFNYTRTGVSNIIRVGRISFVTRQLDTINLSNVFPIEASEATGENPNYDQVVIEIVGDTDYTGGIEYLVSVVDSNIYTNEGRTVPISLEVTIDDDLGTENNNYFIARYNANTSIYKRIVGNTLVGNQMLLVGYIAPNTSGNIDGIDATLTIKAYLDKNKIKISDTYDGTESDNMGTTNDWAEGKTVITTSEWNDLQQNGVSFKIKVEANEGIWVNQPLYDVIEVKNLNTTTNQPIMDNEASEFVSASTGIDFSEISSDTNGKGVYMRAGTENDDYPIMYYRGVVNNNVYFAGKCWQIVRTTETGGTKIIYNGENIGTIDNPSCENTNGTDRQITMNINGTDVNTFSFSGDELIDSPAYNGYTYNSPVYSATNGSYASGSKFGNSVTWDGTNYTITDVSVTLDGSHHYTCGTTNTTTCGSIRYYFSYYTEGSSNYYLYFELTNGKTIENVLSESLGNGATNSNAKAMVEEWYEENIDSIDDSKIEDTIYCNDRSIAYFGGLNSDAIALSDYADYRIEHLVYSGFKRLYEDFNPTTRCIRQQDSFTKNSTNGNGLLEYPVGLITADEISMAGGVLGKANKYFYLNTGEAYWSMSPYFFTGYGAAYKFSLAFSRYTGSYIGNSNDNFTLGLRPVVSLKYGTPVVSGTGTVNDPYVIG